MALKDRFRKAIRSSTSSSPSPSSTANATPIPSVPGTGTTTPIGSSSHPNGTSPPSITLTKSSSRLTKTLTWRSHSTSNKPSKEEKKARKRIDEWEKKDAEEWIEPKSRYPGRKSKQHQDMLRAFEWKFSEGRGSFEGGRSWSCHSGISPGQSRVPSVADGEGGACRVVNGRKRSSGAGVGGGLSREVTRDESGEGVSPVAEE